MGKGDFISKLSFPGLGIPEFEVDRVAFEINIGKLHLAVGWYGMIICIGIILHSHHLILHRAIRLLRVQLSLLHV